MATNIWSSFSESPCSFNVWQLCGQFLFVERLTHSVLPPHNLRLRNSHNLWGYFINILMEYCGNRKSVYFCEQYSWTTDSPEKLFVPIFPFNRLFIIAIDLKGTNNVYLFTDNRTSCFLFHKFSLNNLIIKSRWFEFICLMKSFMRCIASIST